MLNQDVLQRDPATYQIADGGVAQVEFPPALADMDRLQAQLSTFVCEGAYADALRRVLESYNATLAQGADAPAAWISGFYGSGKSLLAAMLAALWTDIRFQDGARAEGLVPSMPADLRAALRELRGNAKRLGVDLLVGGATLGSGASDPVKAVLGVVMRAAGLPATSDLRPMLAALWLAEQGVLQPVQEALGEEFPRALEAFLLDDRIAAAAVAAKPALGADADALMDRLNSQFLTEPEATPDMLVDKARQALTLRGKGIPLTLIVLDEVQQFLREDPDRTLAVQLIAERLSARFKGRVLLVCTGQSALGDIPYLEKLLGRFPLRYPLGSADITSVVRKTVLLKRDTARPQVQQMLDARSGELDRHLQGSALARGEADRAEAVADWPLLSTRRKLWERVLQELDRSGLGATLRSQLRLARDAVGQYGARDLGTAVPGDFLLENFGAEALSRQLIGREFFDKVETLRAEPGDGKLRARILLVTYMLQRIAGDAPSHGVRATADAIADLLVEDLGNAAALRAKVPGLLAALAAEGHVIDVGGEWRLQSKESAEWQAAFNKAQVEEAADVNAIARHRSQLLESVLEEALATAGQVMHGASKTPRRIERVRGADKPNGAGLLLRLWNGWDHGTAVLDEVRAADPATDATLHLFVPVHRAKDLGDAIATIRAVPRAMQGQGAPTTEGGRQAKAAMQTRLENAQAAAKEVLGEAVRDAKVWIAGGAEAGAGVPRADAVKEAAGRVLDRLFPEFGTADSAAWERVVTKAKAREPDALKEVGYAGEVADHPVCKKLLQSLGAGKRGSELRALFERSPYGWPKAAVDAGLRVLALHNLVRVADASHKPTDLAGATDTQLGTYHFTAESRAVTVGEKLKLRGLGAALGLSIASGQEIEHLLPVVERLAALAAEAGGDAPAPAAPEVPSMAAFRSATGNDLLAELAARAAELSALIPAWKAAAKTRADRQKAWHLAQKLIALGAAAQRAEADAILANRSLLVEPDPVQPLVSAAAETLRAAANAAYEAWRQAWDAGETALKSDAAWGNLSPEQRDALRAQHALKTRPAPDLSDPARIAESLSARGVAQWRDMAAAHPARVEAALRDAAVEVEPKTQVVPITRPTLRTEDDVDAWLAAIRAAIVPRLSAGPVRPTA